MSDEDLFAQEMSGVTPLKVEARHLKRDQSLSDEQKKIRQAVASEEETADLNALSTDHLELVDPLAYLEFKKPGIQHGVLKNLRLGKYEIEAKLDLHNRTVEEARRDVFEFVDDCQRYGLRTVIIAHGKGQRSEPKALLKSHVYRWLPQLPQVMAFYSAQPKHGGVGATYVMLRKSDEKKLENKERHERRR